MTIAFGQAGDRPVAGDWDGDGKASVGVVRARSFLLGRGSPPTRRHPRVPSVGEVPADGLVSA